MVVFAKLTLPSEGVTRKVNFERPPTWEQLSVKIETIFSTYHLNAHDLAVAYTDLDGDEVAISSNEELRDYYNAENVKQGSTIKFNIKRQATSIPQVPSSVGGGRTGRPETPDEDHDWARVDKGGLSDPPLRSMPLFDPLGMGNTAYAYIPAVGDDRGPSPAISEARIEEVPSTRSQSAQSLDPQSFRPTPPGRSAMPSRNERDIPSRNDPSRNANRPKPKGRATASATPAPGLRDEPVVVDLPEDDRRGTRFESRSSTTARPLSPDPLPRPTREGTRDFREREPTRQSTRGPVREPTRYYSLAPEDDIEYDRDPIREPTRDPIRQPTRDYGRDPLRGTTREFNRDPIRGATFGPEPVQEYGRDPRRESTRDFGRDPIREPTRDQWRDPVREPTRDFDPDPTRNPTRYFSLDPMREPTKDFGRDPIRESTFGPGPVRGATRDFGREPPDDREFGRMPTRDFGSDPIGGRRRVEIPSRSPSPVREYSRQPTRDFTRGPTREPSRDLRNSKTPRDARRRSLSPAADRDGALVSPALYSDITEVMAQLTSIMNRVSDGAYFRRTMDTATEDARDAAMETARKAIEEASKSVGESLNAVSQYFGSQRPTWKPDVSASRRPTGFYQEADTTGIGPRGLGRDSFADPPLDPRLSSPRRPWSYMDQRRPSPGPQPPYVVPSGLTPPLGRAGAGGPPPFVPPLSGPRGTVFVQQPPPGDMYYGAPQPFTHSPYGQPLATAPDPMQRFAPPPIPPPGVAPLDPYLPSSSGHKGSAAHRAERDRLEAVKEAYKQEKATFRAQRDAERQAREERKALRQKGGPGLDELTEKLRVTLGSGANGLPGGMPRRRSRSRGDSDEEPEPEAPTPIRPKAHRALFEPPTTGQPVEPGEWENTAPFFNVHTNIGWQPPAPNASSSLHRGPYHEQNERLLQRLRELDVTPNKYPDLVEVVKQETRNNLTTPDDQMVNRIMDKVMEKPKKKKKPATPEPEPIPVPEPEPEPIIELVPEPIQPAQPATPLSATAPGKKTKGKGKRGQ